MARSKTVSLTGAAAKAFLGLQGFPLQAEKTDEDKLMEVATAIFLQMKDKDHAKAVQILKIFRVQCQRGDVPTKTRGIRLTMTRKRALELGLLTCSCGHPENNHFAFEFRGCAHCDCKAYREQGVTGVTLAP